MKILILISLLTLASCTKRDVFLPKTNNSVLKTVDDFSLVYMFYETKNQDTILNLNKRNLISTTNWVFNIDKRLPLRLVIPEVIKLQEKRKENSIHQKEDAQIYYSYANDSIKAIAFLPFIKVNYKTKSPDKNSSDNILELRKIAGKDSLFFNQKHINNKDLKKFATDNYQNSNKSIQLYINKNCSYYSYIKLKVTIATSKIEISNEEYFY